MVERLFRLIHQEVRGIHEAAYLLGLFAVFSQILALVRDRLLAGAFGAGATLDTYYAAFRIPDIIFAGVASLVSVYVLIPFFSEKTQEGKERARVFLNSIFTGYLIIMGVVSVVAFFAAPYLLRLMYPELSGAGGAELVLFTRVLLLQPFLLGFSSLLGTITQLHRKFFLYAFSPLLYNLGIIIGIVVLYPHMGLPGLVWGVVLGAALHVAIQIPYTVRSGYFPLPTLRISLQEIYRVVKLSLPRTLALSANQIALLVITSVASGIAAGSIAVFTLGFNLQSVPLAIIGVSYSVAAFPTLARLFSEGSRDAFFAQITAASRHIVFWSMPTLALFIVLRAQIVRVILGSGAFSWNDTRLTAAALALFVVSLLAQSLVLLLVRGYYAAGKTATPLIINIGSALSTILFSFGLLHLFQTTPTFAYFIESLLRVEHIPGTAVLMLPLGYMLGQILNATLLLFLFERDFNRFAHALMRTGAQSFSAAVCAGFVCYLLLNALDNVFDINTFTGIFSQGLLAGLGAIIAGVVLLKLLGSRELHEIGISLHSRILRAPAVAAEDIEPTV